MNDKQPYEQKIEDQLNNLPLPDEDMAWEDMRRRLEKDDDKPVPFFWFYKKWILGLIGIIILVIGWWILRPEKWWNKKRATENITITTSKDDHTINSNKIINPGDPSENTINDQKAKNELPAPNRDRRNGAPGIISLDKVDQKKQESKQKETKTASPKSKINRSEAKLPGSGSKNKSASPLKVSEKGSQPIIESDTNYTEQKELVQSQNQTAIPLPGKNDETTIEPKDSVPMKNDLFLSRDSANKRPAVKKKQIKKVAVTNEEIADSTVESEKIFYSAGMGLQQHIPIDGQELVAYSSLGRNNLLADYIPSVYFQANNPEKWFANIGFRYGAPQYNKEFTYNEHIAYDSSSQSNIITSLILKKSFYHQVPVSFNYHILPNWSAGIGVVWNKFYGAVADKEISKITGQTDSLVSKKMISFKSDSTSSFSKSYFQALFQTEYSWKRFYFGIRYTLGLQPYIQFALPRSAEQKVRNRWLQVFICYDIWRSKNE
jgi:hypothetical protein